MACRLWCEGCAPQVHACLATCHKHEFVAEPFDSGSGPCAHT